MSSNAFESLVWDSHGEPKSMRYDDIYRSSGTDHLGGLAQARHVFLNGCSLMDSKALWRNAASWSILETGFGLGLNFLATWAQWRADPNPPKRLNFVSIEAHPVAPSDLTKGVAHWPELQALAKALQSQYLAVGAGFQTLLFEEGHISLTLCVGDVQALLPEIVGEFDSIFLDGFSPERNPRMWETLTLKGIANHAKYGAQLATWCVKSQVRERLKSVGFKVHKHEGLPPKRECLSASFEPHWLENDSPTPLNHRSSHEALIVGQGLAGSSLARSLAQRGYKVRLMEERLSRGTDLAQDVKPLRAGAHGLPLALFHPMQSKDNNLQSKMTRMGIRMLLARLDDLGLSSSEFKRIEVLERKKPSKRASTELPQGHEPDAFKATPLCPTPDPIEVDWEHPRSSAWSTTNAMPAGMGRLSTGEQVLHQEAGWLNPQALIKALLDHPNIEVMEGFRVHAIAPMVSEPQGEEDIPKRWKVLGETGLGVETSLLILCTGFHTKELISGLLDTKVDAQTWPMQAIKGQLTMGSMNALMELINPFMSKHSKLFTGEWAHVDQASLVTQIRKDEAQGDDPRFCIGSTFERDQAKIENTANSERLNLLGLARVLKREFGLEVKPEHLQRIMKLHNWSGVRCTTPDRMPMAGELAAGLWINTALGSRGLSLCTLMAETLACLIEREPLPLPKRLMKSIAWHRWARRPSTPTP